MNEDDEKEKENKVTGAKNTKGEKHKLKKLKNARKAASRQPHITEMFSKKAGGKRRANDES